MRFDVPDRFARWFVGKMPCHELLQSGIRWLQWRCFTVEDRLLEACSDPNVCRGGSSSTQQRMFPLTLKRLQELEECRPFPNDNSFLMFDRSPRFRNIITLITNAKWTVIDTIVTANMNDTEEVAAWKLMIIDWNIRNWHGSSRNGTTLHWYKASRRGAEHQSSIFGADDNGYRCYS